MHRSRFAISRSRWALGAAVIAAAALALAGCSSGSSSAPAPAGSPASATAGGTSSAAAGSSSAADTAFYNGKTLTLIVPSKPGGGYDAWGRLMSIWMGQYLHATIKVTNVPAGNTIVGQNELASSPGNGLFFGMINPGTDAQLKASNTKGLNFDPSTDVQYIGAISGGVDAICVQSSSPYKTLADLQKATSPVTVVAQSAGTTSLEIRTVFGAYGVKAKFITGYSSTADQAAGFLRGDGVAASVTFSTILDSIKDGKVRPIIASHLPASDSNGYQEMKDVPTIPELLAQTPPTSADGKEAMTALAGVLSFSYGFAMPKSTPAAQVAALSEAMQWAMKQPGLLSAAKKQGLVTGFVDPATVQQTMVTTFKNAAALAPYASTSG